MTDFTTDEHRERVARLYAEYLNAYDAEAPADIVSELRKKWSRALDEQFNLEPTPELHYQAPTPELLEAEYVSGPHPAFLLTLGAVVGAALVLVGALIARWIA